MSLCKACSHFAGYVMLDMSWLVYIECRCIHKGGQQDGVCSAGAVCQAGTGCEGAAGVPPDCAGLPLLLRAQENDQHHLPNWRLVSPCTSWHTPLCALLPVMVCSNALQQAASLMLATCICSVLLLYLVRTHCCLRFAAKSAHLLTLSLLCVTLRLFFDLNLLMPCRIEGMMCARLFTKGAAEQILELCTLRIKDDSGVARFSQQEKQDLLDSFSGDGTRYSTFSQSD